MKKNADNIEGGLDGVLPEIHSMGVSIFDPVWAQKTHSSENCELLHIISGNVRLIAGRQSIDARQGDVLLIPSGQQHRDVFDLETGLEVFMLVFSWKGMEKRFFADVSNESFQGRPAAGKNQLTRMLERLKLENEGDARGSLLVNRARLLTALLYMRRECMKAGEKPEANGDSGGLARRQKMLAAAKEYLEQHYHEPVSLDGIASALKVSPYYLSHVFSAESDFSLFTYLTSLRMNKARALLAEGKLSIKVIAARVGYDNSNYFSKVFRRHFGHAPHSDLGGS